MATRRAVLSRLAAAGLAVTAGCTSGAGTVTESSADSPTASASVSPTATTTGAVTEVEVGPEGRLRFVPETVTIAVGDTVSWTFESAGHNVTSLPGASGKVRNPEGAEPFASYEGDRHFSINEVGTTFEHTFTVAGEYIYVCAPHEDQGMVATVVVEEA